VSVRSSKTSYRTRHILGRVAGWSLPSAVTLFEGSGAFLAVVPPYMKGVRRLTVAPFLPIAPGASRDDTAHALIGIFGVGGKRAGIALGEMVEIRTRFNNGKSIQIDLTTEWIESPSWDLDIYVVPEIERGTTTVDITKVRQGFDKDDVERIRQHLGATYNWFINQGCVIELNGTPILPTTFEAWAYPPDYLPRQAKFTIEPSEGKFLDVTLSGGLILDRDPEAEN
jgi:hypothetical protein